MKKQLIPLSIFTGLVIILAIGLTLDPKDVPSPLIGKPAASFDLPRLYSTDTFNPQQLKGQPWILNIWASWCVSCKQEHKNLMSFASKNKTVIVGLNYKDTANDAKDWLKNLGNPYQFVVQDSSGRAAIDWGVYGVPETFVINKQGLISHKFTGPLTKQRINDELIPLLKTLQN